MNAVFSCVCILSVLLLLFRAPESVLPTLLSGGTAASALCLSLLASYALWSGIMEIWQDCGLTKILAKRLKPLVKKLFAVEKEETAEAVCMNLSANLLGVGGAATPYGIRAANLMDEEKNGRYASSMLLVLNASSLQLFPTTVVSMRAALRSGSPSDVILPTLLCSVLSTLFAITLSVLFLRGKKEKDKPNRFAALKKTRAST